ncbi:MAG: asparagine--tRNA ligase [Alphaproteobacteria bacterium]|nr:asparagine--tRNA ligase [Alphaproteobacteria bacterium]MCB9696376.1 asparagine--tRNA ligase [Alphaproteobacteria bacterium]
MAGVDRRVRISHLLKSAQIGQQVEVTGWVKTSRFSKNVSFVHVMDGSTPNTLQVVIRPELVEAFQHRLGVGAAVRITGTLVPSPGAEQPFEVAAETIVIVGDSDPSTYPMQKKATSLEFLRTVNHLRPRSNTHQAVFRARNALAWQIHRFFQERGFLWIHTPILTGADAEGAGELFPISNAVDFFGHPAFLTVSGQLEVECFAQSHTDVYTFGPTFRAENSNTPRHAAEFWMIEPEMAFADLDDVIALTEDFIREVALATMDQCADDFAFFGKRIAPGHPEQVRQVVSKPFARITYTEAQELLAKSGRTFEFPIGWGTSMQAEHERYLAEEVFQGPVFVTNYPWEQKAFYMRLDEDGKTVAATDLLVPRIGEVVGGSQREERADVLEQQILRRGMHMDHLQWYLDLRRFGTTPHGGFGLGFERMLMWLTGVANIRDVIAFPRVPGASF